MKSYVTFAVSVAMMLGAGTAYAAGAHGGGHGHASDAKIGMPGTGDHVDRTIEVDMTDNAYSLESLAVKEGETIRFIITNSGDFLHEFSIGTSHMHEEHRDEMMTMMDMHDEMAAQSMAGDHDDPNSLLLDPGQSGELIWIFGEAIDLQFACNVPGHYESGMWGDLKVMH